MDKTLKKNKSPSQKLRDTLFVYFSKVKNGKTKEFEQFYLSEMTRISNAYQNKIL